MPAKGHDKYLPNQELSVTKKLYVTLAALASTVQKDVTFYLHSGR